MAVELKFEKVIGKVPFCKSCHIIIVLSIGMSMHSVKQGGGLFHLTPVTSPTTIETFKYQLSSYLHQAVFATWINPPWAKVDAVSIESGQLCLILAML